MTTVDSVGASRSAFSSAQWWQGYRGRVPETYLEVIAAESGASRILHFHPSVVPGLLQTREYATAITPVTMLHTPSDEEVAMHVDLRMRRQHDLFEGSGTTRVVFLLEEISIRRPVGSRATMRRQLDHLVHMASHPAVSLIVLPFQAPPHPGIAGAFMLIQYADPRAADVLCFEAHLGNVVIRDRPHLTAAYGRLADRLMGTGLSGGEAVKAIRSIRDDIGA